MKQGKTPTWPQRLKTALREPDMIEHILAAITLLTIIGIWWVVTWWATTQVIQGNFD